ncbi:MAG: MopE-related protein [Deltaproteobacteria bacterium]
MNDGPPVLEPKGRNMEMRGASSGRKNLSTARTLLALAAAIAFGTACGGTNHPGGDGTGGDGTVDGTVGDGRTDGDPSDVSTDRVAADVQPGDATNDVTGTDGGSDVPVGTDGGADVPVGTDGGDTGICVPTAEACNGRDDNCNGMVDEGLGTSTCGVGECRHTVPNCLAGATQTCTPGTASAEICDGLDNDCNSMVDDGLGQTTCGVGGCLRTVDNCVSGSAQTCVAGRSATETCNGIDDNCNGMVDDGLGSTTCGTGACQHTVQNCVAGAPQTCVAGTATPEICDGVDNNCDGTVDEGLGSSSCGVGGCRVTVQNCLAGVVQTCTPRAPGVEVCNNIDDDCNGMVDDGLGLLSCGVGACQRSVAACIGGVSQTCIPGAAGTETCNGLDDNCNGTVDEGNPGGGGACVSGRPGVCSAGTNQCTAGAITCVPNVAATTEICDGLDNNCNTIVDDGGAALCTAPNVAASACAGTSGCQITTCAAGYYAVNPGFGAGCSCHDPSPSNTTCGAAQNLGPVSAGAILDSPLSATPAASGIGAEDWWVVSFASARLGAPGGGTPHVTFSAASDPSYRFAVFIGTACATNVVGFCGDGTSPSGLRDYDFVDNQATAGVAEWSTELQTWPTTLYIRVTRVTAGPSCATYQLHITR